MKSQQVTSAAGSGAGLNLGHAQFNTWKVSMNTFYEESLACIYVPKDKGQYIVFKGIES
jgi:hypothetical protein